MVLNRRFLHINSRWLREKAVQLTARWARTSMTIMTVYKYIIQYKYYEVL